VPALSESTNGYLAAVGSRKIERAAALIEQAGEGRPVGSYQEVLENPAVDVVYIPLPNSLHFEWTLASLAAGKHVLCEKPLAMRQTAVEELVRAAAEAGRVVMEGFMYRFHPQYEAGTWDKLLAEISPIRTAHVRLSFTFDRPGDIRQDPALGGGALWDTGCYCLDLLGWHLGEVVEVKAIGNLRGDCDWSAAVQLRFASGVLATAWWSFDAAMAQRLTIVGEGGVLDLETPFRATGAAAATVNTGGETRVVELPTDDCFRREIEHVGHVVRGEASLAIPLSDSARWIAVAEQVEHQIRSPQKPASRHR
jgi:predicted dehydrogenase